MLVVEDVSLTRVRAAGRAEDPGEDLDLKKKALLRFHRGINAALSKQQKAPCLLVNV